jgi:pimeloyl-ACP methyl ester carboxylesterase
MLSVMLSRLLPVTLLIGLMLSALTVRAASVSCKPARVDVGGYKLWMQVAGVGEPTVVFESGGGDDSSVWAKIEPEIRRDGVRTVIYDRAGLGQSDLKSGPYSIDHEARGLERALDRCGVRGPIVLVAHSYGGFVSALVAGEDLRVVGVVFVDANLADYFDEAEVARILAEYTPQFAALAHAKPKLAAVLIPMMQAYPDTAKRLRAGVFPPDLPVIDIVAEHSWSNTPEEAAAMRRVHAAFVAASPAREAVFASGSSHYVMRDRPELVIDAIKRMVERARSVVRQDGRVLRVRR